jgi:hypothetical protein
MPLPSPLPTAPRTHTPSRCHVPEPRTRPPRGLAPGRPGRAGQVLANRDAAGGLGAEAATGALVELVKRFRGEGAGGLIPADFVRHYLWEADPAGYTEGGWGGVGSCGRARVAREGGACAAWGWLVAVEERPAAQRQ